MDPNLRRIINEVGDLYAALGIKPTKDEKVIKKAYKHRARGLHPDNSRDPETNKKFIQLKDAYNILMDPQEKAQYDRYRKKQQRYARNIKGNNKTLEEQHAEEIERMRAWEEEQSREEDVDRRTKENREEQQYREREYQIKLDEELCQRQENIYGEQRNRKMKDMSLISRLNYGYSSRLYGGQSGRELNTMRNIMSNVVCYSL